MSSENERRLDIIKLSDDEKDVIILDQTRLPNHEEYLRIHEEEVAWKAIKLLQVRGAPAIGIFAGYSMYVLAQRYEELPYPEFLEKFRKQADYLNSSRPTAVNLSWALKRQIKVVEDNSDKPVAEIVKLLGKEAKAIEEENTEMTRRIAEYGATLIKDGDGILTHCNAGYLACLGYGTATAPIYYATEQGMKLHVFADEVLAEGQARGARAGYLGCVLAGNFLSHSGVTRQSRIQFLHDCRRSPLLRPIDSRRAARTAQRIVYIASHQNIGLRQAGI